MYLTIDTEMFGKICSSHCLAETQCEVCSCQKRWSEESTNLFPPEDDDNPHHNDDSRAADQTVKPREMLDLFDRVGKMIRETEMETNNVANYD